MPVFNNALAGAAGSGGAAAYEIERSIRFDSGDQAFLSRTPSTSGNSRTWTYSCWVKRTAFGGYPRLFGTYTASYVGWDIEFKNDDRLEIHYSPDGSSYPIRRITAAKYRDPGAWMHVVVAVDLTLGNNDNSVRLFVNGLEVTEFDTKTNSSSITTTNINTATAHRIGYNYSYSDFYLADVHFLDGQTPGTATDDANGSVTGTPNAEYLTDFGEFDATTGVWNPIEFTGSHNAAASGTNYTNISTLAALSGSTLDSSYNDVSKVFDGSGTGVRTVSETSNQGEKLSITFSPAITLNNETVSIDTSGTYQGMFVTVDGSDGSRVSGSDSAVTTLTTGSLSGSLSKITVDNGTDSSGRPASILRIRIGGTVLLDPAPAGVNGFHLDFSDTSSNAALGTDSSGNNNTWTVNNLIAGQFSPTITTSGDPTTSTNSPFSTGDRHSVDFDGNDKLTMPGPGVVSGDYTMECFVKASSYSGIQRFFSANEGVNSGQSTMLRAYNGAHEFYHKGGVSDSGTTIPTNQWNHLAMTRSGSTVSYYMNGSRLGTDTNSDAITITTLVVAHGFGSEYFTGAVSNARFVDGQALYTGASYTVPTLTLTTTSQGASADNVRALCCHQNTVTGVEGVLSAGSDIDSLIDSPTNYEADSGNNGGNYATLSPLNHIGNGTLSNGNLEVAGGTYVWHGFSTIGVSSGKWYAEITGLDGGGGSNYEIGIVDLEQLGTNTTQVFDAFSRGFGYRNDAYKITNNAATSYGVTYTNGDVVGMAVDLDNGTLTFYKNGQSQGTAFTGIPSGYTYHFATFVRNTYDKVAFNFGQRPFSISSVPTGFKSLCTQNLDDPLVADGSAAMDVTTWTGNGSTQTISGLEFSPDLVWIKSRSNSSEHVLVDAIRGSTNVLSSNAISSEYTISDGVTSLNADGFSLGADSFYAYVNDSSRTYVGWTWDAGDSNTSISAGGLNSSVYNSSQTWSNGWSGDINSSYPGTRSFDGDISTGGVVNTSGTATWTAPGSGIAISSSLRVYGRLETSDGGFTINFSDSSTSTIPVNATKQWHTISGAAGKTITSIVVSKAANGYEGIFHAVEIDGKILLDNGVTPVDSFPSIASTTRANPTAGFSIVSYTAGGVDASIGHNLNAKPELIIVKGRTNVDGWAVQHVSLGSTNRLRLNTADASQALSGYWNDTDPTSSVFHVGGDGATSGNNVDYIAYCFAPVEGYSAFGSYTGNGSADGPFVYTGFKTRWLMIKSSSNSGEDWLILDTARDTYNDGDSSALYASLSHADNSTSAITTDILSNGFKCIGTNAATNASGYTYIYAAFAENPFKTARAR